MPRAKRSRRRGAWDDGTVPYVQTPVEIVERMMRMAEVRGRRLRHRSGLGRRPHRDRGGESAGARGLGVDLDPNLVKLATQNARPGPAWAEAGRASRRAISSTPISRRRVWSRCTCCRSSTRSSRRACSRSKPGTRIVSHDGSIGDWPGPTRRSRCARPRSRSAVGGTSKVELWIVPAELGGTWTSQLAQHGGAWALSRSRSATRYWRLPRSPRGVSSSCANTRLRGEGSEARHPTGVVKSRPWHHLLRRHRAARRRDRGRSHCFRRQQQGGLSMARENAPR